MFNLVFLKLVCEELGFYRPGVKFLLIGANDGEYCDICGSLARQYGWSGVAVEPVPEMFERLLATYDAYPDITPVNAAIGTEDGKAVFYEVDHPNIGMQQLGSFRKDAILKHAKDFKNEFGLDLEEAIVEIDVEVISINTLLKEKSLTDLGCMFMDAEGYDWEIIKNIDFDLARPDFIYFETIHVNEQKDQINKFFADSEYTLYQFQYEAIAIINDLNFEILKMIQFAFNTWLESEMHRQLMSYCESDGTYTLKKAGGHFDITKNP